MAYIYTPKYEDNPDFGANPNPGFVGGTLESLQNSIDFGLTNEIENIGRKAFDESEFLSKEQFNQSEYKRPGLDFEQGVHLETAKRAADRYDAKLEHEETIGAMSNGFLRGTSQLVGGTIGFALDPTNLAVAAKVPMLVGAKAAPYVMKLAESQGARRALQAGLGFGEGSAIMAPQAVANFAADNMYGEDPSVLDPLVNIGLAGVMGGAVRGAFGFREHITTNADNVAKETAVNQLASGKSVRVDELMQHGAYEADVRAKLRGSETLQSQAETITAPRDELVRLQEDLKPLTEGRLDSAALSSLTEQRAAERAKLSDIEASLSKLTEEQRQSPENELVKNQQASIEKIRQIDEQVDNHGYAVEAEQHLSDIQKHLDVLEGRLEEKTLRENVDPLFESRANKPISTKKLIDGDYSLEDLKPQSEKRALLDDVRSRLQNNVASALLDARETKPLTADQVKAASEHMQSYKSDSTYNEAESTAFKNEVEALPENLDGDIEHVQKQVESLHETLPEDIKQNLEELKTAGEHVEKVNSALRNIINCLRGE